jgi:opacity protein-like surface antigen
MTRRIHVFAAACAAVLAMAGQATAQPSAADRPIGVEVSGGGSFGHKSSGTVSVEGDYSLNQSLALFAELGYVGNVAPKFITDRANEIASALGGSADVKDKATLFDVGAKYVFKPVFGGYSPYAGLSAGFAHVSKDTMFSVGGTTLDESQLLDQYGVQLGNDLAGSLNKGTFGVLFGVTRDFHERYSLDLSYRYTRIFPRTSEIEGDQGINVNRLQVGVIFRF